MGAFKDMFTSALFLAICLNLFFVVVWEVGFYFLYITKKEDDISKTMALRIVDLLTAELWGVLSPMPSANRDELIDDCMKQINQVAEGQGDDEEMEQQRQQHNRKLLYMSLGLCGVFLVLVILFAVLCGLRCTKKGPQGKCFSRGVYPDQKHMWLELFIVMAGFVAFDFFFFDYIVKTYQPISAGRFQKLFMAPILDNATCFPQLNNPL